MEAAEVLDQMKTELMIAFARRCGGDIIIPASELNATTNFTVKLTRTDNNCLRFEVVRK